MEHGGAHELIHWAAAVVLVIGGAVAAGVAVRERRRRGDPRVAYASPIAGSGRGPEPRPIDRSGAVILAGLSLGAAAIHLAAAPGHYVELGDLGAAFLAAAVFQAAWARAILASPTGRVVAIGVAANAAIVGTWAVSRSIGVPLGGSPLAPEPIGLPDGAATAFELLLIAGLAGRRIRFAPGPLRPLLAVAVVPVVGLVMLMTSLASLAIVAGAEHGAPPAGGHVDAIHETGG
jgi:hypothetical protein